MREARQCGCRGPEDESAGEYPVHIETIHQPAGEKLHGRVGPEKSGEQNAEFRCGNAQLVFQHGGSDGQISPIYVIDEGGNCEEDDNDLEGGRDARGLRWRGVGDEEWPSSSRGEELFATCFDGLDA